MNKLGMTSVVDPPQQFRDALVLLVRQYGCSVSLPVTWHGEPSVEAVDKLDAVWRPTGVAVQLDLRGSYFCRRVQEARRKAGMEPHLFIEDRVSFAPAGEDA